MEEDIYWGDMEPGSWKENVLVWLHGQRPLLAGVGRAVVLFVLVVVASAIGSWVANTMQTGGSVLGEGDASSFLGAGCNVVALDIHGCLVTYTPDAKSSGDSSSGCDAYASSEDISGYLEDVGNNESVKAILLDIDSTGGMPQAAVEIEAALKATKKPSVALIRGYGDSAAYWVASAAHTIVASKESDVGSIGVTSSYVDNAKQNVADGLTYNSLSTGVFKDTGDPNRPLTDEEKTYIHKSLATTLENFIQTVATNRHLAVEKVRALADGSSMLGEEARANGLIDVLGTQEDAKLELEKLIKEKPITCWPQYKK